MIFRQKLLYTALGGVLMLVGMLFSSISPLTAQKDVFGDIRCSSLSVVDKDGKDVVQLDVSEHGGSVSVWGKEGLGLVSLLVNEDGGHVTVIDENIHHVVSLGGGVVAVLKGAKDVVQLRVSEHGGVVVVLDKDEKPGAVLGVDEHGGVVVVLDKDEKTGAKLSVTEYGGRVDVYGKVDRTSRAVLGVNKFGHGAVSTWDKHGYAQ